jgi:hypothetical protein
MRCSTAGEGHRLAGREAEQLAELRRHAQAVAADLAHPHAHVHRLGSELGLQLALAEIAGQLAGAQQVGAHRVAHDEHDAEREDARHARDLETQPCDEQRAPGAGEHEEGQAAADENGDAAPALPPCGHARVGEEQHEQEGVELGERQPRVAHADRESDGLAQVRHVAERGDLAKVQAGVAAEVDAERDHAQADAE